MIKANFNTYNNYVTDSLYQWDINRDLVINGLNLSTAPEIHFSNANMDRSIVRQSTLEGGVVTVRIPNSLLQSELTIKAYVGVYEGDTFKIVEAIEIPVIAKAKPLDYTFEISDDEVYSFKALENKLETTLADVKSLGAAVKVSENTSITMDANTAETTVKIARKNLNGVAIPVITSARYFSDNIDVNRQDIAVPLQITGEYLHAYNVDKKDIIINVDVYEIGVGTLTTKVSELENDAGYLTKQFIDIDNQLVFVLEDSAFVLQGANSGVSGDQNEIYISYHIGEKWSVVRLDNDGIQISSDNNMVVNAENNINMDANNKVIISAKNGVRIGDVATPTKDTDAVNKIYVDGLIGAIDTALDTILALENALIGGDSV